MNLVLGAQGMGGAADLPMVAPEGVDYVVVQTDRFEGDPDTAGPHGPRLSSVYLPLLRGARAIWEIQPERRPRLEALGLATRQLSIGYHPVLDVRSPKEAPDLDCFFFGGIDAHRQGLLQGLVDARVGLEMGGYQDTFLRNEFISRSRLQLCPGRSDGGPAITRLTTLLNMGGLVVVDDDTNLDGLEAYVVHVPSEDWVQGCLALLSADGRRDRARELHERFKMRSFSDLLAPLVTELEVGA